MLKRRRLMMYIIGAELVIIAVNLLAFLNVSSGTTSGITGLVVSDGVILQSGDVKIVTAIVDAFILFFAIGIFLAVELHRPQYHS